MDYYDKTCPHLEHAVRKVMKKAMKNDAMGCDGSVLLDLKGNNTAEKDGPPNISLHAFYMINQAKEVVEALCPGTILCTDILAPATRDSVTLSFSQRGLSMDDLVALSGGHMLGFAHCSSFENRTHNFDSTHDVDPLIYPSFTAVLKKSCPVHNKVKNAGLTLDPTTTKFDNKYYKMILRGRCIFTSNQALLDDLRRKALVSKFAKSRKWFKKAFAE